MPRCHECGFLYEQGRFCGRCGIKMEIPTPSPPRPATPATPSVPDSASTSRSITKELESLQATVKANPGVPKPYIDLTKALIRLGKFDRAFSTYRASRAIAPEDLEIMNLGGLLLEKLGRRDEAIELWESVLKQQETNMEAGMHLARLLLESGRRRDALARLQSWRDKATSHPEILLRVAEIHLSTGNAAAAQEDLAEFRRLAGNTREAFLLLGKAMMVQNFSDGAIRLYREALGQYPDDADFRLGLGKALLAANERGQALLEFERAGQTAPDRVEILFELGRLYGETGMEDRAEEVFEKIRRQSVHSGEVYLEMGRFYLERKRFELAQRELEKARELSPYHPDIIRTLAETYEQKGSFQLAMTEYETFLEAVPATAWALHGLLRCAQPLGAFDRIAKAQKASIDSGNATADAWCDLGETMVRLGRFKEAEAAFESAARLDPTSVRAYQAPELINIEKARSEGQKLVQQAKEAIQKRFLLTAIERLERAMGLAPREVSWMSLLADTYLRIGDIHQASKLLSQVRAAQPQDFFTNMSLARVYELEGKQSLAMELLGSTLKDRPGEVAGHLMQLRLKRSQIQGERFGKDMLSSLVRNSRTELEALGKDSPIAQTVEGYTHILFGMGAKFQSESLQHAQELFEEVLYRIPDFVWAHRGLCLIFRIRGDWRKACHHMQELVRTSSEPASLIHLARLHENFQHFEEAKKCYASLKNLFPENGLFRREFVHMTARENEVGSRNHLLDFLNQCQEQLRDDANYQPWLLFDLACAQTFAARFTPQREEWSKRCLLSWNKAAGHPNSSIWARWGLMEAQREFAKGGEKQRLLPTHLKACEKITREHPDLSHAYLELGRCFLASEDLGQTEKAVATLETAFFLDDHSVPVALLLAKAFRTLGKSARVDAIRQSVLLLEPELQAKL